jgi:hypothetical protein
MCWRIAWVIRSNAASAASRSAEAVKLDRRLNRFRNESTPIASSPAHEMADTKSITFSNPVRRRVFGLSLHVWENVMAISLAAAALVAGGVFVSTYFVIQLTREANREAAEKIAELNQETVRIAADAETLRGRNLDLEKAIAPRELEQVESVNNLKPFAHTRYLIASAADTESRRTAAQIRWILVNAGWKKIRGRAAAYTGRLR